MTSRTNARIAGFAFLFYILVGITQMVLDRAPAGAAPATRLAYLAAHRAEVNLRAP